MTRISTIPTVYADDVKAVIEVSNLRGRFSSDGKFYWSLGGPIGADIAANFPHPLPFSFLIWLAGIPYIGDILPEVVAPTAVSSIPGLQDTTNARFALKTRLAFVETFSAKAECVLYAIKLGWVGSTVHLPPAVAALVTTCSQDPSRLLAEGAAGWPLLILSGALDWHLDGAAVVRKIASKFRNLESHVIEGASYMFFFSDDANGRSLLPLLHRTSQGHQPLSIVHKTNTDFRSVMTLSWVRPLFHNYTSQDSSQAI
ncbi:hypothetical protein LshimejAT787_0903860 [Lyophyllum shimeji]|uniref:Uncharacterized protein n=1 Tax=Lyophyllum shimeji TaxID=47721 RepID=A0A9P3USG7_LYOSH|nr:hypothetical protein LshimejAT787_0903860 [Lyophyllum shimeji]